MTDRDAPLVPLPTERLVGIAPDPATLRPVVRARHDAGVPDRAVAVRYRQDDVTSAREREIGAALVQASATEVSYHGQWVVEYLDLTV